jgi:ABC-type polysaccharide/polyol phosphate transport system ATPase subunit
MANVDLRGVTVAYPLAVTARQRSAFGAAAAALSFGRLGVAPDGETRVVALNNISLSIKNGTRLGVIGRNGSGKSTLLKTIAGIITPMRGRCVVDGTLGCVLSLGAGMDHERTGYENLRMIALLYGMRGRELATVVEEAADFTELGPFLNLPVRTYSSGMVARLCFAIATARHSEVMIVDEVIGTGDSHFINKAVNRVRTLCESSGIVVLASHSPEIMNGFCEEAIWMDSGVIKARGTVDEVWNNYNAA